MLELGLALLIIGAVLLLAPIPLPNIDAVGWLAVLVGVVLLVLALIDVDSAEAMGRSWG